MSAWQRAALALLLGCSGCATVADAGALRAALDQLVGCPDLAGGRVGVVVAEASTGAVLVEHDSARGFAPASNMKLLSGAVALTALGPDYTMATELVARGEVRDGVLQGDLVLRGHGDPTFGEGEAGNRAVAAFVAAVRELGIGKIQGRVLGDGSWLGREILGSGWQWDYLDDDYAAPFGGLCFAGNVVVVHVRPGAAGPSIRVAPAAGAPPSVSVVQGPAGSPTQLAARRALRR